MAGSPSGDQRDLVAVQDRGALAGPARTVRTVEDRPRAAAEVDRGWHVGQDPHRSGRQRRFHRRRGVDLQRRLQLGPGSPARRWRPEKGGCATGWVEDLAVEGEALGRSRGGLTTKLHLAVDGRGLPMAVVLTPGQAGDNPQLLPLLQEISVARTGPGRPRQRPDRVVADKAYSHPSTRRALRSRGIAFTCPERSDQIAAARTRGPPVAGHRPSTRSSTPSATSSNAASPGSSSSAHWPLATPNEPPTSALPSSSPPSSCGSAKIPRTGPSSASLGSCLGWSGAVRWMDDSGGVGRGTGAAGGVRRGDVRAAGQVRSAGQGADVSAWAAVGRAAQVDAADGRAAGGGSPGIAAVRLVLHLGGGA